MLKTELLWLTVMIVLTANLAVETEGDRTNVSTFTMVVPAAESPTQEPARQNIVQHPFKNGVEAATSFEECKDGEVQSVVSLLGHWKSGPGQAEIDASHAKSGDRCLHILGGKENRVTLELAPNVKTDGQISFWAERWTRSFPFIFRVEKFSRGKWSAIYSGDEEIQVGRAFLSKVTIPLGDPNIERLRFSCTSPPNSGVLIDDITLSRAVLQTIKTISADPVTLPVLVGNQSCGLARLNIETEGSLKRISISKIQAKLTGETDVDDIDSFSIYFGGSDPVFRAAKRIGNSLQPKNAMDFSCEQTLSDGTNYFWITCKLKASANIDNFVGVALVSVETSSGKRIAIEGQSLMQRLGVAVRQAGQDGIHTSRIPGLATTTRGTMIGVYDVRRQKGGDLPGDIDVGMSRSTDEGRHWEPMRVIMDMGNDPNFNHDGIGDPSILVDQNTGTIWVAATWSHGNRSWRGSGQGLEPEETGQLMLVRSDDDGNSWSKPINITSQVKIPEWCFILQGPGKGITMRDGTIVFAAQYQDSPQNNRLPHSTIIYSVDHGETWTAGTGAFDDTTEAQVIEVEPGVLMLNCRYNRKSARVVMTTHDMGKTWRRHETSERSLIEPGSCMASLIDVDRESKVDASGLILFSNPNSTRGRHHITIKASRDRGQSWPKKHRLLLDEDQGSGYSCMSMIDEKTVGILYESSQAHMAFQRIPLSDIIPNPEDLDESPTQDGPSSRIPSSSTAGNNLWRCSLWNLGKRESNDYAQARRFDCGNIHSAR